MKKYANVASMYFSPEIKYSSQIDWNEQMLGSFTNPGKTFYKKETVYTRKNYGNVFKTLLKEQKLELRNLVRIGEFLVLKDTGDANMKRYIGDTMMVERVHDGKIFGKLRNNNIWIDLLPEIDLIENLSRSHRNISCIQMIEKERQR